MPDPAQHIRERGNALSLASPISVTLPTRSVKSTSTMTLTTTDIVELTAELKALGVECFRYGELEVRFRDVHPLEERLFSAPRGIEIGPSPKEEEGGKAASDQISDEDLFFSTR